MDQQKFFADIHTYVRTIARKDGFSDSDADDIAQETSILFHKYVDFTDLQNKKFTEILRLKIPYLRCLIKSQYWQINKRRAKYPTTEIDELEYETILVSSIDYLNKWIQADEESIRKQILAKLTDTLDPKALKVFQLILEGYKRRKILEKLDITEQEYDKLKRRIIRQGKRILNQILHNAAP